ncbi:RNA-directed DNA polymerase, eukaryota [Tanacetum coccineum]|uniref:RNA-directed DNA polymerase, eukaryota n=1 Tax=Tanacetum coccineum TaxID=301880 RepID=A0ABQ5HGD8_9ASTR
MATKKGEGLEADLEKYREEVKGNFAALGNNVDSEVEALRKRQELEDKRYEEAKYMLLSLANKDTSYVRPVEPLKKVQTGLKFDDLGFLIPPTNTGTSADGGQKKISEIMGEDDNSWGDYDGFMGDEPRTWFRSLLFCMLSNLDASFLECDISMKEVKGAVISSIIGPNQTAFLSERQILDGCLTANEVIHMAKIEDHKLLLLKVDFEKAFDSVCWNFLLDIMTHMGFGDKWRQWIAFCLCSASISIFINSSPSKEFKMERDDALFFGKWSRSNAKNLIHIIKCFEEASGLKINLSKSRIFGVGINSDEVEAVASYLNCSHDSIPFMYLGLLVGKSLYFYDGWGDVVNQILYRLSAWKEKSLSIGGRLILVKSMFGSIRIYFLSLFKASKKIISLLESLRRRFFWGFKEEQHRISWVKWDSFLATPKLGGLVMVVLPLRLLLVVMVFGAIKDGWCLDGMRLMDIFPRIFALDSFQDCKISDRWGLVNVNWSGMWSRRIPPRGWALDDLDSLISVIGNLSFTKGSDKWVWRGMPWEFLKLAAYLLLFKISCLLIA